MPHGRSSAPARGANAPEGADRVSGAALCIAIVAAIAVWTVIFAWRPANFWLLMAVGVGALGLSALAVRGPFPLSEGVRLIDLATGVAGAAALYAVFAVGKTIVSRVVPGAPAQIGSVYLLRSQAPAWLIAVLLILVIGPGEELFWRGLIQWRLVRWAGPAGGWAAAAALYGGVHIVARNPMLVLAALVAGGFWGLWYLRAGRIAPLVVSHVAWDLTVFLLAPFP